MTIFKDLQITVLQCRFRRQAGLPYAERASPSLSLSTMFFCRHGRESLRVANTGLHAERCSERATVWSSKL